MERGRKRGEKRWRRGERRGKEDNSKTPRAVSTVNAGMCACVRVCVLGVREHRIHTCAADAMSS